MIYHERDGTPIEVDAISEIGTNGASKQESSQSEDT